MTYIYQLYSPSNLPIGKPVQVAGFLRAVEAAGSLWASSPAGCYILIWLYPGRPHELISAIGLGTFLASRNIYLPLTTEGDSNEEL